MDDTSENYPRVSVKAVFLWRNKVLLYKTQNGTIDIPGGGIKFGETFFEALKRELDEEIGFKLREEPQIIHVWSYVSRSRIAHGVYIVYLIKIKKQKDFTSREFPGIQFFWVDEKKIRQMKLLPEMEKLLLKALSS